MSKKVYHIPLKDPCQICGMAASRHKVEHTFRAESDEPNALCGCGLPEANHRVRERNREDDRTERKRVDKRVAHEYQKPNHMISDLCAICGRSEALHRGKRDREEPETEYFGIDGEGQGRRNHRYTMMACSDATGEKRWVLKPERQKDRLTTEECLDFILSLPSKRAKIFSYSFNYDLTKMLEDVDDKTLYELFRPNLRPSPITSEGKGSRGPRPLKWREYHLNLQGTKFSVRRRGKKVIIWDLFKFFQGKFVSALKDWKVGTPELWERMSKMKDKRSEFDKESQASVEAYCLEECMCMAQLAKKLVDAHAQADLKLRSFYGAGSSGAAMLTKLGIKEHVRQPMPEMKLAVGSAFFGGRFENSIIGNIEDVIYNRDISSAYPYHTTFLPCLEHGRWSHTTKREALDNRKAACVRYSLGHSNITTWGPFPFRTSEGTISFPIHSGGGWVWLEEYLEGERIFPHVQFREAWVYETECDCQPFADVPKYYILRLQIGKEGPGLVIKLGVNSIYGKLAQSVGNAVFNCWIWAGMVTSGCRAQVLHMLGLHKDWRNLLAIATDGIFTREKIQAPTPKDTGTNIEIRGKTQPLGGWEDETYERGLFFARPGIYFPLNPTKDDIKDVKARGVGKGVVLENWNRIVEAWQRDGINGIATMPSVTRFCGAKTSINHSRHGYKRAQANDGHSPSYGQWIQRKVEMTFRPMPKREEMNPDGTLKLRSFRKDMVSAPYKNVMKSEDAILLAAAKQELMEQPDGDLTDYDLSDFDGDEG